jgi:hypothetical protein
MDSKVANSLPSPASLTTTPTTTTATNCKKKNPEKEKKKTSLRVFFRQEKKKSYFLQKIDNRRIPRNQNQRKKNPFLFLGLKHNFYFSRQIYTKKRINSSRKKKNGILLTRYGTTSR